MHDIKDTVLVLDDEPMFLDWLEDYLTSKGFKTKFVTNVSDALAEVTANRYRALVVDLNVPVTAELMKTLDEKGPVYKEYRGLIVADKARNSGYRDKQVIIYSVHGSQSVKEIADKLRISYITKGRPHIFKEEIEDILKYDPSEKNA